MTVLIGCVKCERRGGIVEGRGQKKEAESRMNRAWKSDLSGETELQKPRVPSPVSPVPSAPPSSLSRADRNMQKVNGGEKRRALQMMTIELNFCYPLFFPSTGPGAPHPETPVGLTWKYLRSQMVADFTFTLLGALL